MAACQLVMAKAQELEREEKWTEAFEKYKLAIDAPLKILASEPNSHRLAEMFLKNSCTSNFYTVLDSLFL